MYDTPDRYTGMGGEYIRHPETKVRYTREEWDKLQQLPPPPPPTDPQPQATESPA